MLAESPPIDEISVAGHCEARGQTSARVYRAERILGVSVHHFDGDALV